MCLADLKQCTLHTVIVLLLLLPSTETKQVVLSAVQFLGSEIQKSQDVVILVSQLPKQEQIGLNPTVVRISILGEDMAQVDAAKAAMIDKISAWRTE